MSQNLTDNMNGMLTDLEKFLSNCSTKALRKCIKDFRSIIQVFQELCRLKIGYHAESRNETVNRSSKILETILLLLTQKRAAQNIQSSISDRYSFEFYYTNNPRNNQNHVKQGIENNQNHVSKGYQNHVNQGIESNQKTEDETNLKHTERRRGEANNGQKDAKEGYLIRWRDIRLDVLSMYYNLVIHILRYFGYIVYLNFTFFATEKISNFKEASDEYEEINLFHSKDSGLHSIPERLNNEHADQGRHSEKKEIVKISDIKSDSKPEDKKCPSPRCALQDTPKAETLVPMNRMSNDTRNKENFKTNSHAENLDANVFLFTFTHEALPRYSYHRDMIVDVQNSFKVSVLDGRTPERGQVVVICRDEELRDIQAFISDEQPENIETTSLVKAADMVDCIVLSERVQDCTMQVDRKLKQHFSGRPRRDVQLCILILNGSPTPSSGLPDGDQHLKYINAPLDTAPIRQFVSSALEMRFLEKLETLKAQQSRGQGNKSKRLLREVETVEKSLKHYSKFNDVPQNESTEIPDAVMEVITEHKMHIQSYGMRKGVIKIRVNQEHYQVVSEDIKSTGIDVDIRSVDITEDPIVSFARQGCRLIRGDEKYGTLGTFANYTVRSGENKLVALTCAHVCSSGDEVSVVLNDETKRFGKCIDDTCSGQGSEQAHSDLSVIEIEREMNNNCLRRHLYRKNTKDIKETDNAIVCEDLNKAPPGKVHKVGATTGWTHGEIIGYDNVRRRQDNKFWSYFLVNSYNKSSSFAERGDSGAVVSTVKFDECNREHALYLGMVSAGPKREKLVRPLPSNSKMSNTSSDMIPERSSTQHIVTKTSTTPGSFARRVSETHIEAGKARESRTRQKTHREGGEYTEHADSMQDESNSGLPVHQRPETSTQSETENSELRGAEGYAKTPICRKEEENLSTYLQPRETTKHADSRRAEDNSKLAVHHRPKTSTQNVAESSKVRGAEGYTETPTCRGGDLSTSTQPRGANGYPVPVVTLPSAERTSGSAENDDNSISSTDSSDDIYCTALQPNLQSLHLSVNFNLR